MSQPFQLSHLCVCVCVSTTVLTCLQKWHNAIGMQQEALQDNCVEKCAHSEACWNTSIRLVFEVNKKTHIYHRLL